MRDMFFSRVSSLVSQMCSSGRICIHNLAKFGASLGESKVEIMIRIYYMKEVFSIRNKMV